MSQDHSDCAFKTGAAKKCHRCQEIIAWLQDRETGRTVVCPICGTYRSKGKQWVVDKDHDVMDEVWYLSARPAYCSSCGWSWAMKDVVYLKSGASRSGVLLAAASSRTGRAKSDWLERNHRDLELGGEGS